MSLAVVILAAGQGTRMQSKKQKVLHEVGGKPMIAHAFAAAAAVADLPPVVVVAPGDTGVPALLGARATFVEQPQQLGTGHAALMARPVLQGRASEVIVTYADMPLLRAETLSRLAETTRERDAVVTMLSAAGEPESSFGRVVRNAAGQVIEIVEVAEAQQRPQSAQLLAIREHNVGVYCFAGDWLWAHIGALPLRQARSGPEYYLTDMIALAVSQGLGVEALPLTDPDEYLGAGTRSELVEVEKALRRRAARRWLEHGVTLVDPASTYIDQDVTIGQDTTIWPNSYLQGATVIAADCVIGPNTIIRNAQIGAGCRIEQAVVENAVLPAGTVVAPFTVVSGTQNPADAGRQPGM